MATAERKDPYSAGHFMVEIDGITRAGFQACSGLDSQTAVVAYREGDEPGTTRKVPGLETYSNVILKWGSSDDTDLWKWRQKVVDGKIERKNLSVVLVDATGAEKVRWNLTHAWPATWTGPSLDASGSAIAIEQLVIAHEGVKRA
jgi:phage tail-like protein